MEQNQSAQLAALLKINYPEHAPKLQSVLHYDGLPLDEPPFELRPRAREVELVTGPRIGITKAAARPWRYGLAGTAFLSRPFPRATTSFTRS